MIDLPLSAKLLLELTMDATKREQMLTAARLLGPEKFNRLVSSVAAVRSLGRLRYWQEELITKISNSGELIKLGANDFISVFDGAQLMPEPPQVVTKEEFFARPNYWYYLGGAPIPNEWVAEAWGQLPEFRDNVTYEFEREASKVGNLDAIQSSLEFLDRVLSLDRMVEIYGKVRASSPHREEEFRPTFQRVFGDRMSAFPASLSREEVIGALTVFGFDHAAALELMGENQSDNTGPTHSGEDIPF